MGAPKQPHKDNYLTLGSTSSITHQRTLKPLHCVYPELRLEAEATPGNSQHCFTDYR